MPEHALATHDAKIELPGYGYGDDGGGEGVHTFCLALPSNSIHKFQRSPDMEQLQTSESSRAPLGSSRVAQLQK